MPEQFGMEGQRLKNKWVTKQYYCTLGFVGFHVIKILIFSHASRYS